MADSTQISRFRFWLWLIALIGVIVPRRLRADWRQEWEAELRYREEMLAAWDRLDWRNKLDLLWRSASAFWDALWLQPKRLEDEMFQDLRYGMRMFLNRPGFSLVVIFVLALGIGATSAIFTVVNSVLLRPLPFPEPDRLMVYSASERGGRSGGISSVTAPDFVEWRAQCRSCAQMAAHTGAQPGNLTGGAEPDRVRIARVSENLFATMGAQPLLGRTFLPEEIGRPSSGGDIQPTKSTVVILSYGLWQRRFGADAAIIGKTVKVEGDVCAVIGVMPDGFKFPDEADVWLPVTLSPTRNNAYLRVIARLQPDVTQAQAQAELTTLAQRLQQESPQRNRALTVNLIPLQEQIVGNVRSSLLIFLGAVSFVLLIACANVANLLLARAVARRKEFALRAVLGAGRLRLIRQLLTESALLALLGGALGVLVARWAIALLKNFRPSDDAQFWTSYTRTFDFFTINMDWRVLIFNFALALATGVLFGLIPAIQSSFANVNESLKEGAVGSVAGFRNLRRLSARGLLVVGEIALSLVLLIGAGLMIKSLMRLQAVNLGFSPENVITMAAPSRDAKPELYHQLLARVQSLPGVEAASLGSTAPLLGYASKTIMEIEGRTEGGPAGVGIHSASPEFFKTLRINALKGRVFTEQDRIGAPRVALINQAAAERLFPGEEPIGKRIRPYIDPEYETDEKFVAIVGVVADVKYGRLEEAVEPDVYLSSLQPTDAAQTLIVRSSVDPAAIVASVRREVLALDKNVPLTQIQTMTERAAEVTSRTRFIAVLLGLFAALALLLAAMGIYGVMAYSVSARTREMGIRIALGAQTRDVLRLVMRDGLMLLAAGLAIGSIAAFAAARVLRSQLYEVNSNDPMTALRCE
jgi:putative ABC transport system permease protein